jgi:hypothetical protein
MKVSHFVLALTALAFPVTALEEKGNPLRKLSKESKKSKKTSSPTASPTSPTCFTSGALVEMADGTLVPIERIKQGDVIATGISGDTGRVSAVLVHEVNPEKPINVVVIATPHGDLVGTLTHPVFLDERWMELQDAMEAGMFDTQAQARMDQHQVDIFYNLEIDGDNPGISSHSYVVNGVVASGLGDNVVLNSLFPRQNVWKQEQ